MLNKLSIREVGSKRYDHGQTVGLFIPTARPGQADLQALRDAAEKLEADFAV